MNINTDDHERTPQWWASARGPRGCRLSSAQAFFCEEDAEGLHWQESLLYEHER